VHWDLEGKGECHWYDCSNCNKFVVAVWLVVEVELVLQKIAKDQRPPLERWVVKEKVEDDGYFSDSVPLVCCKDDSEKDVGLEVGPH